MKLIHAIKQFIQFCSIAVFGTKQPEREIPPETPLYYAVEAIYADIVRLYRHHLERLNRSAWQSFCHSMISGIAMAIRNEHQFWLIYQCLKKGSPIPNEVTEENLILYNHLQAMLTYTKHESMPVHPDSMSTLVTGAIWDRFRRENPDAVKEEKKYDLFRRSSFYKPIMPFDVRYPSELKKNHE